MESLTMDNSNMESAMNPQMIRAKKLLLVIGIVGIIMFFAGLTSMHIVSRGAAAYWVNITMPTAFWWSTVLIILSSITLIGAVKAVKQGKKKLLNGLLILSLALGLAFVQSQVTGWSDMADKGLHLRGGFLENLKGEYGKDYYITTQEGLRVEYKNGHYYDPADPMGEKIIDEEIGTFRNPAARNLITLTGLHALHVLGGILWLVYLVVLGLMGRLTPAKSLNVTQGATYWHFVDILWVYLLLFLYFIH
ncbi:MAG: hypothetical protein HKN45_07625 [Flavobacteriales bacterium]|nr:hypothetical protein [Flavobacteriales bacterium]